MHEQYKKKHKTLTFFTLRTVVASLTFTNIWHNTCSMFAAWSTNRWRRKTVRL